MLFLKEKHCFPCLFVKLSKNKEKNSLSCYYDCEVIFMTKNNIRSLFWSGYSLTKLIVKVFIYLVFIFYILNISTKANNLSTQLLFFIIGGLVLIGSLYYEYLKYLYSNMIEALTRRCSITDAEVKKINLINRDFFNGFNGSIIIFNSLLLIDKGKYEECLSYMEKNYDFFHGTLDYLFIYHHNRAYCHLFLKNYQAGITDCTNLLEFKNISKKKYSPLFSFDEIIGIKYHLEGLHRKAIRSFKKVDINRLNEREKTYIYYFISLAYRELHDDSKVGLYLKKLRISGNELAIAQNTNYKGGELNEKFQ